MFSTQRCSRAVARVAPALAVCAGLLAGAPSMADPIELVSRSSPGVPGEFASVLSRISSNGNAIAFVSGTGFDANDTNGNYDVYVSVGGIIQRASVDSAEVGLAAESTQTAISGAGRYVAFQSGGAYAPGASPGTLNVFLRDLVSGGTQLISRPASGAANGGSSDPAVNDDASVIAFRSGASNLVASDLNARADIFVLGPGGTELMSQGVNGQANQSSFAPFISADGRFVTFRTAATNLLGTVTNGKTHVFLRDRQTNVTELVSVSSNEVEGNNNSSGGALSADGRFVVFSSIAGNLVDGDVSQQDVFLRDRLNGTTTKISVNSQGVAADGSSYGPSISADGRFVAFISDASNLGGQQVLGLNDVYVRDLLTGTTRLVTTDSGGGEPNDSSDSGLISGDGKSVVFDSNASDIIAGDNNNQPDVFLRRFPRAIVTVSAAPSGGGSVSGGGEYWTEVSHTVTAVPKAGYTFAGWKEGSTTVSTSASYTFVLNANRTLVANFSAGVAHTLTVSAAPAAGGTAEGGGTFPHGSSRTVKATPASGYRFVRWTEGSTQVSTSASYTFPLNANRTLVANFALVTHMLAVSALPAGGGTVSGAGTFAHGSSRTVTASPKVGYRFVRWTENGAQVSTTASYTFPLNANRTLVANFITASYSIALTAAPATGGTISGAGTFPANSVRTVTATAKPGFAFVRWTEGGTLVSTSASYAFTLASNRSLVATFRDPQRRNDLLAVFGGPGLWQYLNNAAWLKIHSASPLALAAGDLDGNGTDEAIGSFPGSGLLARYNGASSWKTLLSIVPRFVVAGDFDGNGLDDVAVDLANSGIWVLRNNTLPWVKVSAAASQGLAVGDFDGNGKSDLLADLGSGGLWVLPNGTAAWAQLSSASPNWMATGDLDGTRQDEVLIDLGSSGIFARYNNAGGWVNLHASASQGLATGDLDGNGKKELLADLGTAGLWGFFNNSGSWVKLNTGNPAIIATVDLNRSGRVELLASFASGLWEKLDNGGWVKLNTSPARLMTGAALD